MTTDKLWIVRNNKCASIRFRSVWWQLAKRRSKTKSPLPTHSDRTLDRMMKTVSSAQKSRNCYRQLLEEVCEDDPVFHVIDSIGTEVGKWEFQGQRGEYFRLNSALQNSRKKVFKVSVTAREIDPGKICSFGTRNSDRRNWCRRRRAASVGVACQGMSGHINYGASGDQV